MQFIGLYDINGKEIYESDIIEITFSDGMTKVKYKVFYFEEGAFFQLENINDSYDLETFCGLSKNQFKVIGNTYENLEIISN